MSGLDNTTQSCPACDQRAEHGCVPIGMEHTCGAPINYPAHQRPARDRGAVSQQSSSGSEIRDDEAAGEPAATQEQRPGAATAPPDPSHAEVEAAFALLSAPKESDHETGPTYWEWPCGCFHLMMGQTVGESYVQPADHVRAMSERSNSCPVETLRAHLRQQAERIGELERTLDNPWSQGASFPGYTVCDQCGCFHHITRPHDCKPEVQPPERCATLPGVIRRHYRPMPGLDEPSGPVVIVHFGTIWAWGSDEATAYMRFEEKLMKAQAAAEQRGRLKGLEQAIEWSSRGTLDGNARAELARLRVEAKE